MTIERFDCGTHYDGGVMLDSDDGEYVYHKDYSALEAKCAALAAENAALKSFLGECVVPQSEGNWTGNGEKTAYVSAVDWMPIAPATDKFLAEVRAKGVEMFATELGNVHKQLRSGSNHAHAIKSVVFRAVEFSAQLLKGVQP